MDISKEIVDIAEKGAYSLENRKTRGISYPRTIDRTRKRDDVDRMNDQLTIQSWLKEGIRWLVGDALDPQLANHLGPQDVVVANKFLCHMDPPDAEKCLRNIAHVVAPGGYLFVSGIDLDVRTRVAQDLGWTPIADLIEEIHNGDPSVRNDWPWKYWGLAPFDRNRHDWAVRYASVFQLGKP